MTSELTCLTTKMPHVAPCATGVRQRHLNGALDDEDPPDGRTHVDQDLRVGFGLHQTLGHADRHERIAFLVGLGRTNRLIVEDDFNRRVRGRVANDHCLRRCGADTHN